MLVYALYLHSLHKRPNLKMKIQAKQLSGSLPVSFRTHHTRQKVFCGANASAYFPAASTKKSETVL